MLPHNTCDLRDSPFLYDEICGAKIGISITAFCRFDEAHFCHFVLHACLVSLKWSARFQEDYRRAVWDLDEREFINMRLSLMEIRNHYVGFAVFLLCRVAVFLRWRTNGYNV